MLSTPTTQSAITTYTSQNRIAWHFSPERAPHFGGLWEALVKSLKFHLQRVMGNYRFTFEELTTMLCQIEMCLNSRPLLPLYSHSTKGIDVLSHGHFLLGRHPQSLPELSLMSEKLPLLKRWNLCHALVQHLWKRWSAEYLQQMQTLTKRRTPKRNLQVNDMVLIKEDSIITTRWPLGRIMETFTGKDGHVWVAMVKTSSGVYKRPVIKLRCC